MNILVFANFPPFVMGGAENQVARLVEGWLDLGHTVEIAGFAIPKTKVEVGRHVIQLHHLHVYKAAGRPGRGVTYLLSLLLFLVRNGSRFDIIYTRGLGDAALSVCIAKLFRLCDLPLVACPINAGGKGDVNFIKSIPGSGHLIKLINHHCNGINCIAQAIKDDLQKIGIVVPFLAEIPNGIPVLPLERTALASGARRLLFTGRLSAQKGLNLLVNAFGALRREGFNFRCDIVGDGPLRVELRTQIERANLGDCIFLKGPVEGKVVRDLLIQTDVFVMPSLYEGMSNSVLEAMEAGLPLVVTRCGGVDHYIGLENGWTCPPGDQQALTNALRQMLLAPTSVLQAMGKANRKLVEKQFVIEQIAQKNTNYFNEVLEHVRRCSKTS